MLAIGVWVITAAGQNRLAVDPQIRVRDGFSLSVAAEIRGTRFMEFDPNGTLFVSQPDSHQISACRDSNGDGYYETITVFVEDHPTVHGVFWFDSWLWFTESGAIFRARDTTGDGVADEQQTIIPEDQLPHGGHWWRPILIHKGRLYTGIGDSGNITDESATDRQKIWTYNLQGAGQAALHLGHSQHREARGPTGHG